MSVDESAKKKRRSKWDQTAPGATSPPAESNPDASVSAAAAAARINAMLAAQGKIAKPASVQSSSFSSALAQSSSIHPALRTETAEIEINDSKARGTLTKGPTLNDITKSTGASISVRGKYMTAEEKGAADSTPEEKPLYLLVEALTPSQVNAAVMKVKEIMRQADNPSAGIMPLPPPHLLKPNVPPSQTHHPGGHHYVQDKVFVGISDAPEDFGLLDKLQGPGGSFLGHIASTTGAKVFLRGRGSGYLEPTSGRESFEAMYIYVSHPNQTGLASAKKLCTNLIEHVQQEYQTFKKKPQFHNPYASYHQPHHPPPGSYNPYFQSPYPAPLAYGAPAGQSAPVYPPPHGPAPLQYGPGPAPQVNSGVAAPQYGPGTAPQYAPGPAAQYGPGPGPAALPVNPGPAPPGPPAAPYGPGPVPQTAPAPQYGPNPDPRANPGIQFGPTSQPNPGPAGPSPALPYHPGPAPQYPPPGAPPLPNQGPAPPPPIPQGPHLHPSIPTDFHSKQSYNGEYVNAPPTVGPHPPVQSAQDSLPAPATGSNDNEGLSDAAQSSAAQLPVSAPAIPPQNLAYHELPRNSQGSVDLPKRKFTEKQPYMETASHTDGDNGATTAAAAAKENPRNSHAETSDETPRAAMSGDSEEVESEQKKETEKSAVVIPESKPNAQSCPDDAMPPPSFAPSLNMRGIKRPIPQSEPNPVPAKMTRVLVAYDTGDSDSDTDT